MILHRTSFGNGEETLVIQYYYVHVVSAMCHEMGHDFILYPMLFLTSLVSSRYCMYSIWNFASFSQHVQSVSFSCCTLRYLALDACRYSSSIHILAFQAPEIRVFSVALRKGFWHDIHIEFHSDHEQQRKP